MTRVLTGHQKHQRVTAHGVQTRYGRRNGRQ